MGTLAISRATFQSKTKETTAVSKNKWKKLDLFVISLRQLGSGRLKARYLATTTSYMRRHLTTVLIKLLLKGGITDDRQYLSLSKCPYQKQNVE